MGRRRPARRSGWRSRSSRRTRRRSAPTRTGRARRWRGRRCRSSSGGPGAPVGGGSILSGHLDVVPPGDPATWTVDPWGGEIRDGALYGRGACDMKGGVAVDPRRGPGARARAGDLDAARRRADRRARPVRGGRRAGDAGRDPGRRDRRPGDHHRAVQPRCRRRPRRRDHVPADRARAGGPRLAAARGRLRARQAVRARPGARGRRDAAQRGRDRPADDRARPAVPDDHRHRRGRGVGLDRARPGHRRRPLRRPARPVRGRGRGRAAGARSPPPAPPTTFLRDHPATVEITGGRFGSARVPSDHPLPVGLADVVEDVTGRRPALLGEPYGADMQMFVNVGGTPCVIFGPGRRPGRPQRRRARPARRGRGLRAGPGRVGPPGVDRASPCSGDQVSRLHDARSCDRARPPRTGTGR